MKTNRWVIFGILILALTAFGFGCGGTASTSSLIPGGSPSDLDGDGIPDSEDNDADNDGYLGDADDCDDLNPSINPDALDKPDHPNYTDSNCDGVDGEFDFAYWVAPDGNDLNPGTIDQPFLTIQKGVDEAIAIPGDIRDVYVVGGNYNEDVMLVDGADIYGGFGPLDVDNLRSRNIEDNTTRIIPVVNPFVVFTTSTGQESVVEGLTVESIPNTPAVAIYNSSPTIRYNTISGADGTNVSIGLITGASGADEISRPTIHNNVIESGDASNVNSKSVAVIVLSTGLNAVSEPTFYSNEIKSNLADEFSVGMLVLEIDPTSNTSVTAYKNSIEAGTAGDSAGIIMGYNIFDGSDATFAGAELYQNEVYGGENSDASYGIASMFASESVSIYNNFVTGGRNATTGAAALITRDSNVTITNNTLNAGSAGTIAQGIHLGNNTVSTIENNILFVESAPARAAIVEESPTSTPTRLRNNLIDTSFDNLYYDFVLGLIGDIDTVNAMVDLEASDNIIGLAQFEDSPNLDYHLRPDSDAIDMGIDQDSLTVDFDDDERPQDDFFDIGADEFTE